MTQAVDLLIVGCGVAGLSAAVAGLESGLSVINLERAPEDDFGGNSRWTEAYLRMKNDSEVADDFEEHFANNAGWNRLRLDRCGFAVGKSGRWNTIVLQILRAPQQGMGDIAIDIAQYGFIDGHL